MASLQTDKNDIQKIDNDQTQSNIHSTAPTSTCQMCQIQTPIYSCPKCSIKTCSLICCLQHKKQYDCDGKRDRTKFVPLHSYNDQTLTNDYFFLEDVLHCSESGKRLIHNLGIPKTTGHQDSHHFHGKKKQKVNHEKTDFDLPTSPLLNLHISSDTTMNATESSTNHQVSNLNGNNATNLNNIAHDQDGDWLKKYPLNKQKIVQQARERNINLLLMAPGMQRHIYNSKGTRWDTKNNVMFWNIDFVFHYFDSNKDDHSNQNEEKNNIATTESNHHHSTCVIPLKNCSELTKISSLLYDILPPILRACKNHHSLLQPFIKSIASSSLFTSKHNHSTKQKDSDTKPNPDEVCILWKRLPSKSNQPLYQTITIFQKQEQKIINEQQQQQECKIDNVNIDNSSSSIMMTTDNIQNHSDVGVGTIKVVDDDNDDVVGMNELSLKNVLSGKCIIEYPTFEIVFKKDLVHFPLWICEDQ